MSLVQELDRLSQLHRDGELSNDEYARAKARVLNGAGTANQLAGGINALSRSRQERWIAGVCGGLARVSGLAPWLWRVLFTVLVLFGGSGVLIYVLLWIFLPEDPLAVPPRAVEHHPAG